MSAKQKSRKTIKAVELKNKIQSDLYKDTKNLSGQELIEFYKKAGRSGPFKKKEYKKAI